MFVSIELDVFAERWDVHIPAAAGADELGEPTRPPRLAVNERLADAAAIPVEVKLEIDPRLSMIGARPERLRCVHRLHPRLLSGDHERIEDAKAHVAAAEPVALAAYVHRDRPVEEPADRTTASAP